jgi:hypothetical protein
VVGRDLYGLVAPARLVRQRCHAGIGGAVGQAPRSATPATVNDACHRGAPCRASACGTTKWFSRATRARATKRVKFANIF